MNDIDYIKQMLGLINIGVILLLLLVISHVCFAGPNSIPPVEIQLQKIEVRAAEPYNPAEYEDPIAYPRKEAALEAIKSNGGLYMFNPVLERHEVLWRKKGLK